MRITLNLNTYTNPIFKNNRVSFKKSAKAVNIADNLPEFPDGFLASNLVRDKIVSKRLSLLKPIKDEKEYMKVLNRVLRYPLYKYDIEQNSFILSQPKNAFNEKIPLLDTEFIELSGYEKVKNNLKGLVAYCGSSDISRQINCWLTGRKDENPTLLNDKQMADVVRALEYSLRELDKIYGKYDGTVYRAGVFNPIADKQYYSSSDYLSCALKHSLYKSPSLNLPYNIIKLKKGHYLYDFQKDTNSDISNTFALSEREILIDRHSCFRRVPKEEYTFQDNVDINYVIKYTSNCDIKDLDEYTLKQMKDNIFVWEEI